MTEAGPARYYDVRVSPLQGRRGGRTGRLVVIQDIRKIIEDNDFSFLDQADLDTLSEITPPADIHPLIMEETVPSFRMASYQKAIYTWTTIKSMKSHVRMW